MPYYVSRGNHDRVSSELWESTWSRALNYSFENEDCAFIVVDTADEKGRYVCPDVDWIQNEMKRYSTSKMLFVFMHITPRTWTKNGIDCRKLTKLFSRQKNLKAIFHGHDHDQDNVMRFGNKPYFFDGHIGGNWGVDYRGFRIVEILKNQSVVTYQMDPAEKAKINSLELA